MCLWLHELGAEIYGLALQPNTKPALFDQLDLSSRVHHRIGDITNPTTVFDYVSDVQPEIVFHFAAQSLVLQSYELTLNTWGTNVQGTAILLEALRNAARPATIVAITTDKVYHNTESDHAYSETDRLGGIDPYSASKAGTELVINSYRSLFAQEELPLSLASARAGNVIGGGDWCENRLLPDIARALSKGQSIETRNPNAVRPWQHVLEPLSGYLLLAEKLYGDSAFADSFNFGPELSENRTVEDVIKSALKIWSGTYQLTSGRSAPHEAGLLRLSIERARSKLNWRPRWNFGETIARTMNWYKKVHEGSSPLEMTLQDLEAYRDT